MADTTNLRKTYHYKVYTPQGTFLGLLQNVTSLFEYSQPINSAGTELSITVGVTADTADEPVLQIETENNLVITTEDTADLTTERSPDLVGAGNSNALIANDNLIEVYEISRYSPNGTIVFSGFIDKWKTVFGGDDDVEVTCLSKGQDLQHYLVPGSVADTLDQSQATEPDNTVIDSTYRYGQTFTTGVGVTNISKIILKMYHPFNGSRTFTLKLWPNSASATLGGTPLGSVSVVVAATSATETTFTFSSPITTTASTQYFFSIEIDSGSIPADTNTWGVIQVSKSNPYASGQMYRSDAGGAWTDSVIGSAWDFYFKIYYSGNSTAKTYTSSDPSTGILTDLMAYYTASGGAITLSTPTATGVSATYTFNLNTTLEGIKKVFDLGPANWYWYVDPATSMLYYKAAATTADYTIIKGRHIEELAIEATKENIINVVYFTGGIGTGSTNVYVNVNDTASLVVNRRGLDRLNDPKVIGASGEATGRILAQNDIDLNSAETYQTKVIVIDDTFDISLFTLGQMIGFSGFGTFVDNLLLQIVGIERGEDQIQLSLGSLQKRATQQVEEIRSSLLATQTVDNPTTPS